MAMKQFAALFTRLDQTNKTNTKVAVLKDYFAQAPDHDKLWALALFTHKRPKRQVNATRLREWTAHEANLPLWLLEESYHIVGDLAETMSLLLPPPHTEQHEGLAYWIHYINALKDLEETEKQEKVVAAWRQMDRAERFVFTKLMTGGFRVGVSQNLVVRAVAEVLEQDKAAIAHRLMGQWNPDETTFEGLLLEEQASEDLSRPYPFFLAHPLEDAPESLGSPAAWQAEWKWDGIRSQLIVRQDEIYIWSRGEELVTDKFPELAALKEALPNGTVLDGEILPWKEGRPLPFGLLQTRIGRKNLTKKVLETAPVHLMAYDLLEWQGQDLRQEPMARRRELLEALLARPNMPEVLHPSPTVPFDNWQKLAETQTTARDQYAEGLMLKKLDSPYEVGRKRGAWWKWKVEPLTIDGVMIYAQRGHGRRADLYSDYTFAVWDGKELVPFAKAYSGLTDKEMGQVDKFVKKNTLERFGPVRTVKPELVFEIGFEGIQSSKRHKSGVALRFPRILRWRQDKPMEEANSLQDLQAMLKQYGDG